MMAADRSQGTVGEEPVFAAQEYPRTLQWGRSVIVLRFKHSKCHGEVIAGLERLREFDTAR
jgi:hypothetical protein